MVLYLDHICQCGSHIGTLMHRITAEPCSSAGLLFPSRCPSGTILLTPYSMVWVTVGLVTGESQVSRAGPMLFYWPKLLYPYSAPTIVVYTFLFFLSINWYCEAGVFRLIGCISVMSLTLSVSLNLALPIFFNNKNFKKYTNLHMMNINL